MGLTAFDKCAGIRLLLCLFLLFHSRLTVTPERFAELASQGYNRIPVVKEILADLDTPLSAYLKLAKGPYSYLLESVEGWEKWGRYSIIGLPARRLLTVSGQTVRVCQDGAVLFASLFARAVYLQPGRVR